MSDIEVTLHTKKLFLITVDRSTGLFDRNIYRFQEMVTRVRQGGRECRAHMWTQKVTINVKVVEVKETIQLGNIVKQHVIIADRSSTAKVSLWEEHVNAMEEHKSHCLKNFIDREFQST